MFVITSIVGTDEEREPAEAHEEAGWVSGGSGVSGTLPHDGRAGAAADGAAEGGGPVGHAVQRAANSAGRAGWTGLRRDRQSHDYTGPGHYPPAGPAGEARADFAQPGEEGPAEGAGHNSAGGRGPAGADGRAGAGDAPQPAGSPGTGAAGSIDGVIAGCAPGNKLILD